ncbi:MAG: cytidylate kinase-like family protein [Clostridiales bacterium]|nr:cytidylate kinase-like family protein [Clostridiales bacterium]
MNICIGRSCGSGGHEIGRLLAQQLGCAYYDQQSIDRCAAQPADQRILESAASVHTTGDVTATIGQATEINKAQIKEQNSFIRKAAESGNCVFVGHCADYVLQEAGVARLSVFVTAPFEDRVKRVREQMGTDEVQTLALIKRENIQREAYYNFVTKNGGWGEPANYDLCVNSSTYGIQGTAALLKRLVEGL